MKKLMLLALTLAFALSVTACDKKGEAAKTDKAAATKKADGKKADGKKDEAKKPEAKKDEAKKPEVKKPEVKKPEVKKPALKKVSDEDMMRWSPTCKKVVECHAAWAKDGKGAYKDVVTEGWEEFKSGLAAAPDRKELGCATALKSWAGFDGAPAACK